MLIGLLGKANVGKSTFFSAATETAVPIGNYPFTTIEPNVGVTYVRTKCACKHFGITHQNELCIDGIRLVPVKLIDVAGLVPGAHEGKGLGNKFLDDARQAEVLIHVVDVAGTTDIQGQPVPVGTHDPLEDIAFVENEFDQWFKQILDREWQKLLREITQKTTNLVDGITKRFSGLGVKEFQVSEILKELNLHAKKPSEWTDSDIFDFVKKLRKKTKPVLVAANKADLCKDLSIVDKIKQNNHVVICSAESELLLRKASKAGLIKYVPGDSAFEIKSQSLNPQQKQALDLVKVVLSKTRTTGIQEAINHAVFDLLKFITVYPVEDEAKLSNKDGVILPDARLLLAGSNAKDLAGTIHADLAKGFLFAIDAKTKLRISADHILQDGDVVKIVSSMSRG
ncbi:redox-regulated ATPase YchF [Candidatus Nitrosotenuis sp. DW1]|uniref:redox-regulated ATPase YchF n=1 Tax=Candidatus Nitrosotenuis sp. DW1 TaxID=2259672 RepID=UPI0015CD8A02|nr:redox-regulated ATPase YchF [Candidatus Nitrosotenuis sp. DW1]QLH08342.1 redox-regulated ATPase YchF [Candidatus Nitrosotenuis sp. DW1]